MERSPDQKTHPGSVAQLPLRPVEEEGDCSWQGLVCVVDKSLPWLLVAEMALQAQRVESCMETGEALVSLLADSPW